MNQLNFLKIYILIYFSTFLLNVLSGDAQFYVTRLVYMAMTVLLLFFCKSDIVSRTAKILLVGYLIGPMSDIIVNIVTDKSSLSPMMNSIVTMPDVFYMLSLPAIMLIPFDLKLKGWVLISHFVSLIPFWLLVESETAREMVALYGLLGFNIISLAVTIVICLHWKNIIPTSQQMQGNDYLQKMLFFFPYGAITRKSYAITWLVSFAMFSMSILSFYFLEKLTIPFFSVFAISISTQLIVFTCWFFVAQSARRCHAKGKSGWMQFISFYNIYLFF